MSSKITDARIKELARLLDVRIEPQEKIRKEREAMQAILASISEKTQELASSFPKR